MNLPSLKILYEATELEESFWIDDEMDGVEIYTIFSFVVHTH